MNEFCDLCDVSLDLHPWPEDEDDPGCSIASMKADVLDRFGRMVAS